MSFDKVSFGRQGELRFVRVCQGTARQARCVELRLLESWLSSMRCGRQGGVCQVESGLVKSRQAGRGWFRCCKSGCVKAGEVGCGEVSSGMVWQARFI